MFSSTIYQQLIMLVNLYVNQFTFHPDRSIHNSMSVITSSVLIFILTLVGKHLEWYQCKFASLFRRASPKHFDMLHALKTTVPAKVLNLPFSQTLQLEVPSANTKWPSMVSSNEVRKHAIRWLIQNYGTCLSMQTVCSFSKTQRRGIEQIDVNFHASFKHVTVENQEFGFIPCWKCTSTNHIVYMKFSKMTPPSCSLDVALYSQSNRAICDVSRDIHQMYVSEQASIVQDSPTLIINTFQIDQHGSFYQQVGDVNHKKHFGMLFFEDKPLLLQTLHSFQHKMLYPAHLGMDNKLGILLFGPPGTGKTACISAIANFLKRNICLIDLSKVRKKDQFDTAFSYWRDKRDEVMYVLEEIDCVDVIQPRDSLSTSKKELSTQEMVIMMCASNNNASKGNTAQPLLHTTNDDSDDRLDLAYILTKLDGIESNEGRLLIATTNHQDKIDRALLRPGRFDLKLSLTNCTPIMTRDILSHYFTLPNDSEKVAHVVSTLSSLTITPLELINACMTQNNIELVASHLSSALETK